MDDLGRLAWSSEVGQHRDLLTFISQEQDGSNGSHPIDPGPFLKELVGMALAFTFEPAAAEPPFGVASSCLPSLEVGDKPDLLLVEKAEHVAAISSAVEDQGEGAVSMGIRTVFVGLGAAVRLAG